LNKRTACYANSGLLVEGFFKTELYQDGKLKATVSASARQPRKNSKTIILNGFNF